MILDISPTTTELIIAKAERYGMSVDELLYEFAHTDELYFDMEQMTQAIDSPSVEVPKTALKDLASFERFFKGKFCMKITAKGI